MKQSLTSLPVKRLNALFILFIRFLHIGAPYPDKRINTYRFIRYPVGPMHGAGEVLS